MAGEVPHVTLNDGNSIPQLGLGVWQVPLGDTARVVKTAIEAGYRAIDTAEGYDNEEGVGQAIKDTAVPRQDLFITSKLRNGSHARDKALRAFDDTMQKLGLDQLDLFLIHWPVPGQDRYVEAWKTLIELRDQGRIRSIGVSNFNTDHVDRLIEETGVTPAVNQIELHPYYQQRDKREYLAREDIVIESYSPLGSGAVLDDKTIAAIAKRHDKSPAQIMIRWHIEQGLVVIPKSTHAKRIRENIDVFDFELDDEDWAQIAALDDPRGKVGSDPASNNSVW
jgi:2,5-diketo-D-gluconate reductase A